MPIGWRPLFLIHAHLSIGLLECPYNTAAGFLIQEEERKSHKALDDQGSEVTDYHFCLILFLRSESLSPPLRERELGFICWKECQRICRYVLNHQSDFPSNISRESKQITVTLWIKYHPVFECSAERSQEMRMFYITVLGIVKK